MKVFVAGATGAIGRRLVPMLVAGGHDVVGMTRTPGKRGLLEDMGARAVVADALDADAVGAAVSAVEPDVVVHQLTAIPTSPDMRHIDREFVLTNRLRTEGTDHLLSAARAAGVRRFVAQSFANYFPRTGGTVKVEEDGFDPDPPAGVRATLDAILHVEAAVTGADWLEGLVLRYGAFYGPGTSFTSGPSGEMIALIRKRALPIVGKGTGVFSFVHIDDAARATVDAVERGARGIYNVVDDDPAPVREWLPAAAAAVGAKRPRRLPRWLVRVAAGEMAAIAMTEGRGASNEKIKREIGWRPRYPSWRQGFREGLA